VVLGSMAEEDVREILRWPTVLVASDGPAVAPSGVTGLGP
jgi:hypothetical protein